MAEPSESTAEVSQAPATTVEGPGWRGLAKILAIIWAVELATGLLMGAVMFTAAGFDSTQVQMRIEYVLPAMLLTWTVALLTMWYFACRRFGRSLCEVAAIRRVPGKTLLHSLVLGFACGAIAIVLMAFFANEKGYILDLALEPPKDEGGQPTLSPLFALVALSVPVLEEVYYRGFLYSILRRLAGVSVSFVVIINWFAAVHVPQIFGDWAGVATIFVMGVVFTYLRQRYDSILPSLTAHFVYNGTLVTAGLLGSVLS